MTLFSDNVLSIGHTPLVQLNRLTGKEARVLAKIEARNPAFSVKDRVGVWLVNDAEEKGLLKPGSTIVEPTSGNTGIALAFVAAARGYSAILTMPETMSVERRKILAHLGAKLELTPGAEGMAGAIARAKAIVASDPENFYMPDQFSNPANPAAHEHTTGPEIWEDTKGEVDVLVSAAGTGGTITGIARYLKRVRNKNVLVVAVEPANSPVITQHLAGQPLKPGPHAIQGIGAGFIPSILDLSLIDRVETVENEEAINYARRLASEEGILAGISSGAAVAAAARLATEKTFAGKTIVVILPDGAERYMSSALFADMK